MLDRPSTVDDLSVARGIKSHYPELNMRRTGNPGEGVAFCTRRRGASVKVVVGERHGRL